jgi:hypothetical protein
MIVMLNGSFAVGKTTVTHELLALLPGVMLFAPELVGAAVRLLIAGVPAL